MPIPTVPSPSRDASSRSEGPVVRRSLLSEMLRVWAEHNRRLLEIGVGPL